MTEEHTHDDFDEVADAMIEQLPELADALEAVFSEREGRQDQ